MLDKTSRATAHASAGTVSSRDAYWHVVMISCSAVALARRGMVLARDMRSCLHALAQHVQSAKCKTRSRVARRVVCSSHTAASRPARPSSSGSRSGLEATTPSRSDARSTLQKPQKSPELVISKLQVKTAKFSPISPKFSSRGSAPHPAGAPAPDPGKGSRPRPPKSATRTVTIIPVTTPGGVSVPGHPARRWTVRGPCSHPS